MTITYFPFDSGLGASITEAQWKKMAQNWLGSGVIRGELNQLQTYGDSSGMQVKVRSGAAWIKGHYFESDAEEVLPIGAADPTNPRIDRVVLRVDWVADIVELAVLQGVPAVNPTAPDFTKNTGRWEMSLAQIRVNSGAATIAAGNVTDERVFASDFKEVVYQDASNDGSNFRTLESSIDGKLKDVVTATDGSTKTIAERTKDGIINTPLQSTVYARRTASLSVSSGVDTKVTFNSIEKDTQGEFSLSTNGFTPKEGGTYQISINIYWATVPTTDILLKLFKNGSSFSQNTIGYADKVNNFTRLVTDLVPGERIDFYINQGTSAATMSQFNLFITKIS